MNCPTNSLSTTPQKKLLWPRVRELTVKIYMILLPSLLIFTSLGERTYQDVIFVALLLYWFQRKKYCSFRWLWAIWASWIFYALWSFLTDYLGAEVYDGGWFIRVELMLVSPIFLYWARHSCFNKWLLKGFQLALLVGLPVALWQVFYLHMPRAEGAENALVFAACISIYGLFVIHESIVRKNRCAAHWVVITVAIVALSGSVGAIISIFAGFLMLAFWIPRRQILRSLLLPCLLLGMLTAGLAGDQLERTLLVYQQKGYSGFTVEQIIEDIKNKDFAAHDQQKETVQNIPRTDELRNEYRTSFGYRLVFLIGGWEVFLQHPFIGVGSRDDTLIAGQVLGIGNSLTIFSHVHNAFLQDMVAGGIVKLISLLTVLFLPIFALYRMRHSSGLSLLLVLSANYIVFGMTNMLFQLTTLNIINTLVLIYIFANVSQLDCSASDRKIM